MNWIDAIEKPTPENEGWYITLYKFDNGEVFPIPLYYQMFWIVPKGLFGTIEYYTEMGKTPIELKKGGIF